MPLRDAVGYHQTVKRAPLLKTNAQVPGMWAKGCVLADFVGVI